VGLIQAITNQNIASKVLAELIIMMIILVGLGYTLLVPDYPLWWWSSRCSLSSQWVTLTFLNDLQLVNWVIMWKFLPKLCSLLKLSPLWYLALTWISHSSYTSTYPKDGSLFSIYRQNNLLLVVAPWCNGMGWLCTTSCVLVAVPINLFVQSCQDAEFILTICNIISFVTKSNRCSSWCFLY
jgi:hypothetical protein